ncbi:MAG: hypothetical protein ACJ0Q8_11650 [Candidatus Azotimanducaceae bacterium]
MSSGKVGLFKQLTAMVSVIALIFGLSVRRFLQPKRLRVKARAGLARALQRRAPERVRELARAQERRLELEQLEQRPELLVRSPVLALEPLLPLAWSVQR